MTPALLPLKSAETAKSRLSGILSPEQRQELFFDMANGVIRTLQASRGIYPVYVVTACSTVAEFTRSLGCEVIDEKQESGMNQALSLGISQLSARQRQRVLIIPGDLPMISKQAIDRLMQAQTMPHQVTIVPDIHGTGTNALMCSPADAIEFQFGPGDSCGRHRQSAVDAGLPCQILNIPELEHDIDTPEDYKTCIKNGIARTA